MIGLRICGVALAVMALSACGKKTLPPVPDVGMANAPCKDVAPWGFPQPASQEAKVEDARRSRKKGTPSVGFICHAGQYALGYDQSLRVPRWTTEIVSPSRQQGEAAKVRKDWRPDPFIPKGLEVLASDYSKDLTKGAIGVKAFVSYKNFANNEVQVGRTFYLSNTAPAIKKDDAPGAWERLEDQVVKWSADKGDLMVISGPIFLNGTPLGWAGHTQKQRRSDEARGVIAIPTHFYKIIVDLKTNEAIAFQVPNDDSSAEMLPSMAKRVSDIELASGLSFFPDVQGQDREKLEKQVNVRLWPIK